MIDRFRPAFEKTIAPFMAAANVAYGIGYILIGCSYLFIRDHLFSKSGENQISSQNNSLEEKICEPLFSFQPSSQILTTSNERKNGTTLYYQCIIYDETMIQYKNTSTK